ncbi:MAG TPA: ATP phosphoribosyltransferase regulatory subunit, partial [Syntrophorhabdaceae bacterium]|nr:ATP phosphoribosyltransferase regulatory subunit [Syntrophorhabdaceae bacterium]
YLCDPCRAHFNGFLEHLNTLKLQVNIEKRLVRGLDYYTRTVFEFISNELGAQNAFLAGGRYNNLVEAIGGPSVPGIGFAIGMDRLAMLIGEPACEKTPQFFFAYVGDRAGVLIMPFMEQFIEKGLKLSYLPQAKSLKSQMRYADALKADYVLIVGDDEIEKGMVIVRDMAEGKQFTIPLDIPTLVQNLRDFLKNNHL